ncbi:MAG: hypothetical protein ABW039_12065 [Sphingobium sp.]
MPIDDAVGEVVGAVARHAGGFAIDLVVDHVFSRHSARFFHGVGRRAIALVMVGRVHIPSSLRMVPPGTRPRPLASDWTALIVGMCVWIAAFAGVGVAATYLL